MRVDIYNEECTTILKTVYPKEAHIPVRYTAYGNNMYDYALLYVEEDLSEYGMFSLGVPTDAFMTSGATVTVSGFPQSTASDPGANCTKRYKSTGSIDSISDDLFDHQIQCKAFSSGGDSGGPIYFEQRFNGNVYHAVIGICTTRGNEDCFGTRITSTLLVFYYNNEMIGSTL